MLLALLRRWSRCCSYSAAVCSLYYGALYVLKYCFAFCLHIASFLSALWSSRLWKRELVMFFSCVCLFVCFAGVSFCPFPLPLSVVVGCGLWLWHSQDFSINFFVHSCDGRLTVWLSRCWLVHYLSLCRADFVIIVVTGLWVSIHSVLHLSLCWAILCHVIGIAKLI